MYSDLATRGRHNPFWLVCPELGSALALVYLEEEETPADLVCFRSRNSLPSSGFGLPSSSLELSGYGPKCLLKS